MRRIPCAGILLLLTLLLIPACSSTGSLAEETQPDLPNIVFILADELGVETLGSYGGTSYATPVLDRLAESGLRFRHAYSMAVCHPTRTTLLTGLYPFRLGRPEWGGFPRDFEGRTFAHLLKDAGYATAVAGKWQLTLLKENTDHPHRLGFDEYSLFGWHEGPRYYEPLIWQNGKIREDTAGRYGPDLYTEFLIDFMERNQDRPFMAFYSMALCHDVTDDLEEPVPHGPYGRYDNYQEMVEAMDERVGRLLEALDRLSLRDRTLVLFTGDNGTPKQSILQAVDGELKRVPIVSRMGEKLIPGGKGELTDGGTHVPLIANWPGTIEPAVTDDLVDFSDLLPTFAELARTAPAWMSSTDGQSFVPTLLGTQGKEREWAFAEHQGRYWVRDQRWKLYGTGEFYDLSEDPEEQSHISSDADSGKEARERLARVLETLNPDASGD